MAFKDSYIDVMSRLACIEISKNVNIKDILKIVDELSAGNEILANLSNNERSFFLVVREQDIGKITKLIRNEDTLSIKEGITSITIHLDPSVKYIPGVYFLIMGQISLNQINIFDVSSYKSDFTLYIDQKEGAKVHQLLYDLSEYQKKFCSPKK